MVILEKMKNGLKYFIVCSIFIVFTLFVVLFKTNNVDIVQAATNNNTSDVQLIARAINGEARGEPYEGQVAVGAVILNRVKSKYNSWCNIPVWCIYSSFR